MDAALKNNENQTAELEKTEKQHSAAKKRYHQTQRFNQCGNSTPRALRLKGSVDRLKRAKREKETKVLDTVDKSLDVMGEAVRMYCRLSTEDNGEEMGEGKEEIRPESSVSQVASAKEEREKLEMQSECSVPALFSAKKGNSEK